MAISEWLDGFSKIGSRGHCHIDIAISEHGTVTGNAAQHILTGLIKGHCGLPAVILGWLGNIVRR